MDRGEFGVVRPCLRTFDGDTQALQDSNKLIQILLGLFNDPSRKRATRNFGQGTIGKFRQLGASIGGGKSCVQRSSYYDFFKLITLIATPYNGPVDLLSSRSAGARPHPSGRIQSDPRVRIVPAGYPAREDQSGGNNADPSFVDKPVNRPDLSHHAQRGTLPPALGRTDA